MKTFLIYFTTLLMLSCNGQDLMTKGKRNESADKIPITLEDFYQDNNYFETPAALIDGNTTTSFVPAWNLIYTPHDVVVDLSDYDATVRKIRIYDSNGDNFKTKLILVRQDNEQEVEVGTYTGSEYNRWLEFEPPASFKASRFIMRGGANNSYGNELELIGEYKPYQQTVYNRPRKPLKNMLGVNAHWWDFLINTNQRPGALDETKYQAFKDLGLTSLRNYGNAKEYQPEKGQWSFNPVRQGWYEDDLFQRLKQDGIFHWSVLQGQFDFIKATWDAAGKASQLNIYYADNNKRDSLKTYEELGKAAFVWAARRGNNKKAPSYQVWSHVDHNPKEWWVSKNEMIKGNSLGDVFEGMNEPNAFWAGYDDYLNGKYLAPAWSVMYDGHKGQYPNCGVKNADPDFKMSTSGLATANTDILKAVYYWSKKNRGVKKDGSVDLPFDIIQFHNYSYTGGLSQYSGGVQGGLPPELSNVLNAVDAFVLFSNKYANGREVWCGEWGYDVNPGSPMNAPAYGPYTAEQTRANWAMRTVLEFSAHGLDRAQWYRLYQDGNWADKDPTQFATMSLLKAHNNKSISRRLVGDYFKQIGELGDFVFKKRLSDHPRVLKFRNGKQVMYAIWGVEKMKKEKEKKPEFTETRESYVLPVPGVSSVVIKQFVDGGSKMSTKTAPVVNGTYKVSYSAKPVFITFTK